MASELIDAVIAAEKHGAGIVDSADEQARQIKDAAAQEAAGILEKYKAEAKKEAEEIIAKATAEGERLKQAANEKATADAGQIKKDALLKSDTAIAGLIKEISGS